MKRARGSVKRRKLMPPETESVRDHGSIAESLGNILRDTTARIEVVTEVVNEANAELSDLHIVKEGVERALHMPPAGVPQTTGGATFSGVSSRR